MNQAGLAAIVGVWLAASSAAATPRSVAEEVHTRGDYPGELKRGERPSFRRSGDCEGGGSCPVGQGGGSEEDDDGDSPGTGGDGTGDSQGGFSGGSREYSYDEGFDPGPDPRARGDDSGDEFDESDSDADGDRTDDGPFAGNGTDPGRSAGTGDGDERGAGSSDEGSEQSPAQAPPPPPPSNDDKPPPKPRQALGSLSGVSTALLILLIALLLVFLFWLLARRRRAPEQAVVEEIPEPTAPAAAAPAPLADYDVLAGAGRWEDAIRAVLLHALAAVGWRPQGRALSVTAREVIQKLDPTDPRRPAVANIVAHAEAVHFAGAPATQERFDAMRQLLGSLSPEQTAT